MKTKIIALALIIASIMMFAGCCDHCVTTNVDSSGTEAIPEVNPEDTLPGRMEFVARDYQISFADFYYFRDVYTDVVYVFVYRSAGYGGGGSFTPLLNADGTPVLWSDIESEMETTK